MDESSSIFPAGASRTDEQTVKLDQSPIAVRWAEIESELDNIQHQISRDEKSVRRRATEWGALFALIVSVAVGGFTIFNNVYLGPEQRRSHDLARLHDIVLQIGQANLDSLSAANSGANSQATFMFQANSIKMPLMFHALEIVRDYPDQVTAPTLMALIPELFSAQEYDRAIEIGELAREKAELEGSTPFFVEATRYVANAHMGKATPEDRETAQGLYAEAVNRAKTLTSINQAWLVSHALADWSAMEAMLANCPESLGAFRRLFEEVETPVGRAALCYGASTVMHRVYNSRTCESKEFAAIREKSGECSQIANMSGQ